MEDLITLENIDAGYNGVKIIENISLSVKENDFLGIIGPNGGGKSTLIKVILGLIKPYKGVLKVRKGSKFGYLPQFTSADRKFPISVQETVISGLLSNKRLFRSFSKKDLENAELLMKKLEIFDMRKEPVGELSGGQMQRAFLCRAMVSNPDILVLDEPNSFVDKGTSSDIYKILLELNSKMAILMVSHDTGVISSYVKNIACVNKTLHYHPGSDITDKMLDKYSCPVELIMHGPIPHRVLRTHQNGGKK
ncbi:MAG: ABC transporter ATP-binding protein [Candidatus Delongbacteria bacterium]|jgi:zinc transport system ATP-binding protein|nr:ABC transporter ATP-binding protein [Candidatus Delongbacteria bacterium]